MWSVLASTPTSCVTLWASGGPWLRWPTSRAHSSEHRFPTPQKPCSAPSARSRSTPRAALTARPLDDGTLDGVDASLGRAADLGGSFVTGNVVFFPRMSVLFGSEATFAKLDRSQRSALDRAASDALKHAVEILPDVEDPTPFCEGGGTVVAASDTELAAMRRAAQPVYTQLEADPATKSAINAIRALARQIGPVSAPTSCGVPRTSNPTSGTALVPDGTYTAVATKADALRLGVQDECALRDDGNHLRLELKDGEFVQWQGCSIVAGPGRLAGPLHRHDGHLHDDRSLLRRGLPRLDVRRALPHLEAARPRERPAAGTRRPADHGPPVGEGRMTTGAAGGGTDLAVEGDLDGQSGPTRASWGDLERSSIGTDAVRRGRAGPNRPAGSPGGGPTPSSVTSTRNTPSRQTTRSAPTRLGRA